MTKRIMELTNEIDSFFGQTAQYNYNAVREIDSLYWDDDSYRVKIIPFLGQHLEDKSFYESFVKRLSEKGFKFLKFGISPSSFSVRDERS